MMIRRFKQILMYELCVQFRQVLEYLHPIIFFILIVSLFPLAISTDTDLLATIAPGIIWVAALMAHLLALQPLFRADQESGFIDKLLLSPAGFSLAVLAKIVAHWSMTGLPLVIVSPFLGVILGLNFHGNIILMVSLLLGTPILSFIGAIAAALTLSVKNNGLLLPLLVLPLFIPVLIFGSSAVIAANQQLVALGQLKVLAALLLLSGMFAPFAAQAALRMGEFS